MDQLNFGNFLKSAMAIGRCATSLFPQIGSQPTTTDANFVHMTCDHGALLVLLENPDAPQVCN
jgi:hypothetical protein